MDQRIEVQRRYGAFSKWRTIAILSPRVASAQEVAHYVRNNPDPLDELFMPLPQYRVIVRTITEFYNV